MTIQLLTKAVRYWDDGKIDSDTMLLDYPDEFSLYDCYNIEMVMLERQAEKNRPGQKYKHFLRFQSLPISTQ